MEGVNSWGYSPAGGPDIYRGKLFRVAYPNLPTAMCITAINEKTFEASIWNQPIDAINHFY